jgi:hypothetical protein
LKKYKYSGSGQIPEELIQAGTQILILFGIRECYLIIRSSLLLYQFTRRAMKLTVATIVGQQITGDHQCGFRRNSTTTDQIFCIRQILKKKMEVQ